MSAFIGTPLDIVLRDCGIDSFVVAGVAMEVGIEPTVRHALDLGYLPVIVTDACGAGDHEAAARRWRRWRLPADRCRPPPPRCRDLLSAGAPS